jgi:hypothetical protein
MAGRGRARWWWWWWWWWWCVANIGAVQAVPVRRRRRRRNAGQRAQVQRAARGGAVPGCTSRERCLAPVYPAPPAAHRCRRRGRGHTASKRARRHARARPRNRGESRHSRGRHGGKRAQRQQRRSATLRLDSAALSKIVESSTSSDLAMLKAALGLRSGNSHLAGLHVACAPRPHVLFAPLTASAASSHSNAWCWLPPRYSRAAAAETWREDMCPSRRPTFKHALPFLLSLLPRLRMVMLRRVMPQRACVLAMRMRMAAGCADAA